MTKKTLVGRFHLAGIPRQGLCGATLGFFIGFAAVSLYGPTAKLFKETMSLSPGLLGLLVSVPIFSGALLRIPLAALVDTTGGRKPFLVLLILSFLGMLGLCFITAVFYPHKMNMELYPLLLLLGALCGCGVATFSVGAGQISYWYPKNKQGMALGIYAGFGNMAPGIFSLLFPVSLFYLGLSLTYFIWVIFLAAGVIVYYLLGKNACYFQLVGQGVAKEEAKLIARKECKEELFPEGTFKDSLLISARARSTWGLALIYFTTFGGFLALVVWLPTYWQMFYSLTIEAASRLTALYAILASFIRILGGGISDRFTGEKTAVLSIYIMLAGSLLMAFSRNINISISGVVLMALGMGVTNAAVFKLVPEAIPHAVGGASGWVGGVGAFGGFVIVNAMTRFIKTENTGDPGYAQGFIIFSVLALASITAIRTIKYRQKS